MNDVQLPFFFLSGIDATPDQSKSRGSVNGAFDFGKALTEYVALEFIPGKVPLKVFSVGTNGDLNRVWTCFGQYSQTLLDVVDGRYVL
jgi:hypothetical protein